MKKKTNLTNFERVQAILNGHLEVAVFKNGKRFRCVLDEYGIDSNSWACSPETIDKGTIEGNRLTVPFEKPDTLEFYHYQPVKL